MIAEIDFCYKHFKQKIFKGHNWLTSLDYVCTECEKEHTETLTQLFMEKEVPPPIPKEALTCGSCSEPCGNEWCCMKDNK